MADCLIDISAINNETLPLILVFVSIIITGTIIRLIYFAEKDKIREQCRLKILDAVVVTTGLIINWVTLFFMKVDYSIDSFKVYTKPITWLYLTITTVVVSFIAWQLRCKGNKWLKDTVTDTISFCIGVFFIILCVVSIGNTISFIQLLSLNNLTQLINNIIRILFSVALLVFFGYGGLKLLKIKDRRYPKSKKIL